jgi:hypothetical protein
MEDFEDILNRMAWVFAQARAEMIDKRARAFCAQVCFKKDLFEFFECLLIPGFPEKCLNALRKSEACLAKRIFNFFIASFKKTKHVQKT